MEDWPPDSKVFVHYSKAMYYDIGCRQHKRTGILEVYNFPFIRQGLHLTRRQRIQEEYGDIGRCVARLCQLRLHGHSVDPRAVPELQRRLKEEQP